MITILKSAVIFFQLQTCIFFCLLFYLLRKNVRKLLRNFEYSKLQKAKKLLSTEAWLKFLIKKCVWPINLFWLTQLNQEAPNCFTPWQA